MARDKYDVGDVVVALKTLSVFLPDSVSVEFDGMDVVMRDKRFIKPLSKKATIQDAAEEIFKGL